MVRPSSSMVTVNNGEEDGVSHVLVVDDSGVERILVEKLFKSSSCKGILLNTIACIFERQILLDMTC